MQEYFTLINGDKIPKLGVGTWFLGDRAYKTDLEALKKGLEIGITLIDTAEMYGNGNAEKLVGDAISGADREKLYLVSKVLPSNAGKGNIRNSLMKTLKNMKTDYLDLYLIHWRGSVPLAESVACMEEFKKEGLIKNWGVSNFDTSDMLELFRVPNGENCAVNQVLYHLGSRGVEFDLLPLLKQHKIPLMAYCPMAQAGSLQSELIYDDTVISIAKKYNISAISLLLKFVLEQDNMIAIPRSGNSNHIVKNWEIKDLEISKEDIQKLNKAFPAPKRKTYLDIV